MSSSNPIHLPEVFAAVSVLLLSIFGQPAYCDDSCSEYYRALLLHEKHISLLKKAANSKPGHTKTVSAEEQARITDLYKRYCYMRDVGRGVACDSEQLKMHSYKRRMENCRRELIQASGASAVIAIDKDLPAKPDPQPGTSPYQALADQLERKRKEVIDVFSAPRRK